MKQITDVHTEIVSNPANAWLWGDNVIGTPIVLVEDILDRLPIDWSDPTLKFLDPACGRGTFLIAILNRLLKAGHTHQHIVENMLFGVDIDEKNAAFTRSFLSARGKYRTNIECCDALTKDWNMKFNVVVGNPPYQDNTEGNGNNIKLWTKFVEKANDLIDTGGHVAYVTPLTWQAPISRVNPVRQVFNDNNLLWVNTDVGHHFDVGSTFSAWIYRKGPRTTTQTEMNGVLVDITKLLYVPNAEHFSIHNKVVFTNTVGGFDVLGDETANVILTKKKPDLLSRVTTETHVYEAFHTNHQSLWSSRPLKNQADKKVLFTTSGHVKPVYDAGMKGVSNTSRFILVSSAHEGNAVASLLWSKLYQFIMETAKWGGFVNVNVIKALPKLSTAKIWTDEELYTHFNLTQEEINLIESTVK